MLLRAESKQSSMMTRFNTFFFFLHSVYIIFECIMVLMLCRCLKCQGRHCLSSHNKDLRHTVLFEICLLYIIRQIFVAVAKCILYQVGRYIFKTSMTWNLVSQFYAIWQTVQNSCRSLLFALLSYCYHQLFGIYLQLGWKRIDLLFDLTSYSQSYHFFVTL